MAVDNAGYPQEQLGGLPPSGGQATTSADGPMPQTQFTSLAPQGDRRADLQGPPPPVSIGDGEDGTQVTPSTPPPNGKGRDDRAKQVTSLTLPPSQRGTDRSNHQTYHPARDGGSSIYLPQVVNQELRDLSTHHHPEHPALAPPSAGSGRQQAGLDEALGSQPKVGLPLRLTGVTLTAQALTATDHWQPPGLGGSPRRW